MKTLPPLLQRFGRVLAWLNSYEHYHPFSVDARDMLDLINIGDTIAFILEGRADPRFDLIPQLVTEYQQQRARVLRLLLQKILND